MSNKIKLFKKPVDKIFKSKQKIQIALPNTISFHSYVADLQGCGTIRCIYPHLLLNQYYDIPKLKIFASYNNYFIDSLSFYKHLLFVQFQRAATAEQLTMIKYIKSKVRNQAGVPLPIIYESDDLLTEIPEWNFAHSYYKKCGTIYFDIIKECDGVICSTETLAKEYSSHNNNIRVIPNHLPKFIWGDIPPVSTNIQKPRILWAGSMNHFSIKKDIKGGDFSIELLDFIRKTVNDYQWVLMGGFPQELDSVRDKIEFHTWKTTFEYPKYLKKLKCDISIIPLEDNRFNKSKSNLKALESVALGLPSVVSNVTPYHGLKVACDTSEFFIDQIQTLAVDVDKRQEVWYHNFKVLESQLWWEESGNLKKYLNTYLDLFNMELP